MTSSLQHMLARNVKFVGRRRLSVSRSISCKSVIGKTCLYACSSHLFSEAYRETCAQNTRLSLIKREEPGAHAPCGIAMDTLHHAWI